MMLEVRDLHVRYGAIEAVRGVSFEVEKGEIVALLGANGAGKTTILRTISGLVAPGRGSIVFCGRDITRVPANRVVGLGISHVPEGRLIFANLSVYENLQLGAYLRKDSGGVEADMERAFGLFPRLKERLRQNAGTLSGGEQQMLAIARAIMSRGSLMLLDEPSMGLSPRLVEDLFIALAEIRRQGTTLLLVEQNASMALSIADRAYVLETGRIVAQGASSDLAQTDEVRAAYLGA